MLSSHPPPPLTLVTEQLEATQLQDRLPRDCRQIHGTLQHTGA